MLSLGLGFYPALFFMSISLYGPILEKWLLSGEAIHKNISVGGAGLVQIPVSEGKTFIITKIEMLPFANIITKDGIFADEVSFSEITSQDLTEILKRIQFQLLFYSLRTNSVYNIRNSINLSMILDKDLNQKVSPSINFDKHSFDCFHIIEDNSWLYLKYFNLNNPVPIATTDQYQLHFDGSQNWPPTNFYGYFDQSDIVGYSFGAGPIGFSYVTQGLQAINPGYTNQLIFPSFDIANDPNQQTSFIPPYPDQSNSQVTSTSLPSIPFYNISVIEINRRLSTKGLL